MATVAAAALAAAIAADAGAPVTFHTDVRPILEKHCQMCHRPGEGAPMPLVTYQEVRPWAKAIRAAVVSGRMPPWHADPRYGKFSNDPSLAPDEKRILLAWIDTDALEGTSAGAPAPRPFPEGWRIPEPDAVFELPQAFAVRAKGAIDYQYFSVPTYFTEDKWVQMAEVRPTDRSVVHHAIVMVEPRDGPRTQEYLAGYAPGASPQIWKPGQARLIKAGSVLVFEMHYTASGKPAQDRTRIGLRFAREPVREQIVTLRAAAYSFLIPPGDPDYHVDSFDTLEETSYLVGMRPHMHVRGKSFLFRAVYPAGESEMLLSVPRYDFAWQPYYYLETPKLLPRGTRIECTAVYDNSPNNPRNPNPAAAVVWGPQSWDEMMIGWFDVARRLPRAGAGAP